MPGPLQSISLLRPCQSCRSSSYDRSGGNDDWIQVPAGEKATLLNTLGSGRVTHIWITMLAEKDPDMRRNMVVRMYWDGQEHPSVEAPIGDFFGQGWSLNYNFVSLPLAAAPRDGMAMVSYFPMPFGSSARIEVENQSESDCERFYFYVDYELGPVGDDEGRFHAWYHQELTTPESGDGMENAWIDGSPDPKNTSDANNYLFCDIVGEGHYVGVNFYVHSPSPPWPGEGDDMFLVDGTPWPGLHGTGTEDYFNTSWGPDEHYLHPYFGIAYAPGRNNNDPRYGWIGRMHYYRFHLEDPIRFQKSLRASIEHGHANGLALDLSSVSYWYQRLPSKPFPALPPAKSRKPRPLQRVEAMHRWRHEWMKARGQGALWGDEE
ncbi:MAG: DUF2961 domain-containing protein [Armatimonadetes bacterium]|nr:DUF2961 domain-containing protein [Armatimonadota bacterium]